MYRPQSRLTLSVTAYPLACLLARETTVRDKLR
jgi:hypothetical protein